MAGQWFIKGSNDQRACELELGHERSEWGYSANAVSQGPVSSGPPVESNYCLATLHIREIIASRMREMDQEQAT